MKNIFKLFVPVAVAAIALVSCQQEIDNTSTNDANAVTIRVHASADEIKADTPEKRHQHTLLQVAAVGHRK